MTLLHIRAFALMAFGLVVILGFTRIGDDRHPMAIHTTPAASTNCVKPQPACGANCTRLIAQRSIA